MKTIMILGSGELGREVVISLKRFGHRVVAVDRYDGAPAMQVADDREVIDMLDGNALSKVVAKHKPEIIIPEIEAIRTEKLKEFERKKIIVVPCAHAAHLTMNRDAIREVASRDLGLRTARYAYAESEEELLKQSKKMGFPVVIKPVMSSSGKGQSVARSESDIKGSWKFACKGMRGDKKRVIVEEFIYFDLEITLLTVRTRTRSGKVRTLFVDPIGHRQERGDYQESWMPARLSPKLLSKAKKMAKRVTDYICKDAPRGAGCGIFGVEFFIGRSGSSSKGAPEVIFSELSPRPHDTGMVTLISQDLSEFDLHVRAILGLPIPKIRYMGPSASAVILSKGTHMRAPRVRGLDHALSEPETEVRIFGKPSAKKFRRMGVALARARTVDGARKKAKRTASRVELLKG